MLFTAEDAEEEKIIYWFNLCVLCGEIHMK